jgi:hypothetical protein
MMGMFHGICRADSWASLEACISISEPVCTIPTPPKESRYWVMSSYTWLNIEPA